MLKLEDVPTAVLELETCIVVIRLGIFALDFEVTDILPEAGSIVMKIISEPT